MKGVVEEVEFERARDPILSFVAPPRPSPSPSTHGYTKAPLSLLSPILSLVAPPRPSPSPNVHSCLYQCGATRVEEDEELDAVAERDPILSFVAPPLPSPSPNTHELLRGEITRGAVRLRSPMRCFVAPPRPSPSPRVHARIFLLVGSPSLSFSELGPEESELGPEASELGPESESERYVRPAPMRCLVPPPFPSPSPHTQ